MPYGLLIAYGVSRSGSQDYAPSQDYQGLSTNKWTGFLPGPGWNALRSDVSFTAFCALVALGQPYGPFLVSYAD